MGLNEKRKLKYRKKAELSPKQEKDYGTATQKGFSGRHYC